MIISLNLYNKYFKSIILLFTTYIYIYIIIINKNINIKYTFYNII